MSSISASLPRRKSIFAIPPLNAAEYPYEIELISAWFLHFSANTVDGMFVEVLNIFKTGMKELENLVLFCVIYNIIEFHPTIIAFDTKVLYTRVGFC